MENQSTNKKSKKKPLKTSLKNRLTAQEIAEYIEGKYNEIKLIKLKTPYFYIKSTSNTETSTSLFQTPQGRMIGIANYPQKGRIITIGSRELFELGLNEKEKDTLLSRLLFELFSWLIDKPRIYGENDKSYILNTMSQFFINLDDFAFDLNNNLYIDSFNSNHQWEDGVEQSVKQIKDALLPKGQWHRHYDCVLLPANANDLQVKFIRDWLKETNGSLIIIFDKTIIPSKHITKLLSESQLTMQSVALPPPTKINSPQKNGELAGLSLKVSSLDPHSSLSTTELIVPQLTFRHLPARMTNMSQPLLWSYQGFIEFPEEGTFILGADTENNDEIIIQLGQQEIILDKDNQFYTLKQQNAQPKKKIAINIKVKTQGNTPSLRLFWLPPNTTKYQLVPKEAFSHNPTPIGKSRKPRHAQDRTTQVAETLSTSPFHQVVKLPQIYTKQLLVTDDIATKANSFSIRIKNKSNNNIVDVHDIKLANITSGKDLAQQLNRNINNILPKPYYLRVTYLNNKIKIYGSHELSLDNLVIYHYPKKYLKKLNTPYRIRNLTNKIIYDIDFSFIYDEIKKISHLSFQFLNSKSINFEQASLDNNTQFSTPQLFARYLQHYIKHFSQEDSIKVSWNKDNKILHIEDHQSRQLKQLKFGHYEQPLPLLFATSNKKQPNTLVMGAIQGELPLQQQALSYDLVEAPQFGHLTWNNKTGEWSYQPYSNEVFKGFDQFQFQAIGKDGIKLPPIGISLQSERPPITSIPGKKIFTIPDPAYTNPLLRYQPIPADMKIHNIYLAQTHLLKPDDPYFSLTAERWALIKIDITSYSSAKSPDFVAIVKDKEGNELGRVNLRGPENLPTTLIEQPKTAEISRKDYDAKSYTAPLKSAWIKPGIKIQLMADNKPIIMPYSDQTGHFSPKVHPGQHAIFRLWNHSYYQSSQGIYPYSMLSWGQEALAKLPISQLTLYSHPTGTIEPLLFKANTQPIHPAYENTNAVYDQQNNHTYHHSFMSQMANGLQKEITYISRSSQYENSILGLGSVGGGYGGGITDSGVLWHESFGHGLGFHHTTSVNSKTAEKKYPYDNQSNGTNFSFDQINDVYLTHHYIDPQSNQYKPMTPSMYPYHSDDGIRPYAAFKPHSDYHTHKATSYFIDQLRWKPNAIRGIDSEDGGFAGVGYHQRWDSKINDWVTLTANNFSQYYPSEQINDLAHQRDVPVYWLSGSFTQCNGHPLETNSELYPLSHLTVFRTKGNLSADYHHLITKKGRSYNPYQPYALKIIYATSSGLLTDILQLPSNISLDQLSLNIPDKGELTRIDLLEIKQYMQLSEPIYTYLNPQALANTLFSKITTTNILTLPNYWRGNKLFWAITDHKLINKNTGEIDYRKVKSNSAIKASWIEKGKYHQQIFSLDNMDTPIDLKKVTLNFHPLNNHEQLYRNNKQQTIRSQNILTESKLTSGTHINEYIDISASPPLKDALYWVKLLWSDRDGTLAETDPLESWYIYQQDNKLVINGVIDSTPEIELAGIRIYTDVHLLDKHAATAITLYQKTFFERQLLAQKKESQPRKMIEDYTPLYERTELFDIRNSTNSEMCLQAHRSAITSPLIIPTLAVS